MKSLTQKIKDYFNKTERDPKNEHPSAWENKAISNTKPKYPQQNNIQQKSPLKSELNEDLGLLAPN
ncbi:hypothetical protein [Acinetobacter guillouiae]|uniref:hypothetical protein n=1 Tax=Acinetobacter guillouiae TaxID=106649 RepID=UPI002FD92BA0